MVTFKFSEILDSNLGFDFLNSLQSLIPIGGFVSKAVVFIHRSCKFLFKGSKKFVSFLGQISFDFELLVGNHWTGKSEDGAK